MLTQIRANKIFQHLTPKDAFAFLVFLFVKHEIVYPTNRYRYDAYCVGFAVCRLRLRVGRVSTGYPTKY